MSKKNSLKIALVCDDLVQFGGAERLLMAIHEIWPEAPVYTSVVSDKWRERLIREKVDLRTSFMQKLPFKESFNRFYSVFGLHILAFESFDFSAYDLVISASSRYAHGVVTSSGTKHICYMNSPSRQIWETSDYFSQEKFLIRVFSFLLMPFLTHARKWDYTAAQRVDHFIANSELPQRRIKKYYGRDSEIVYPFVEIPEELPSSENSDYFLVLSRLLPWKRIDLAVEACGELNLKLKVVGEGPAKSRLEKAAGRDENIEFLGYVSEEEKWKLLASCKALIMTQREDFGITALEAMAAGKPVIAYGRGGAKITVIPAETGEFFMEQTVASLKKVIKDFDPGSYSPDFCKEHAASFRKSKFKDKLERVVNNVYLSLI